MVLVNLWMEIQDKRSEQWPCLSMDCGVKPYPSSLSQRRALGYLSAVQLWTMWIMILIYVICRLLLSSLKLPTPVPLYQCLEYSSFYFCGE